MKETEPWLEATSEMALARALLHICFDMGYVWAGATLLTIDTPEATNPPMEKVINLSLQCMADYDKVRYHRQYLKVYRYDHPFDLPMVPETKSSDLDYGPEPDLTSGGFQPLYYLYNDQEGEE